MKHAWSIAKETLHTYGPRGISYPTAWVARCSSCGAKKTRKTKRDAEEVAEKMDQISPCRRPNPPSSHKITRDRAQSRLTNVGFTTSCSCGWTAFFGTREAREAGIKRHLDGKWPADPYMKRPNPPKPNFAWIRKLSDDDLLAEIRSPSYDADEEEAGVEAKYESRRIEALLDEKARRVRAGTWMKRRRNPIVSESPTERQRRLRLKYDEIVEIDAAMFKALFEQHRGERLAWSSSRAEAATTRPTFTGYPIVYVDPHRLTVDVEDGRHRINEAARRGVPIQVTCHRGCGKLLERLGLTTRRNPMAGDPKKLEKAACNFMPEGDESTQAGWIMTDGWILSLDQDYVSVDTSDDFDSHVDSARESLRAAGYEGGGDTVPLFMKETGAIRFTSFNYPMFQLASVPTTAQIDSCVRIARYWAKGLLTVEIFWTPARRLVQIKAMTPGRVRKTLEALPGLPRGE